MPILGTVGAGSIKSFGGLANLGYFIKNSLRFRSGASANLTRTPGVAGNQRTWTWSAWVKRGTLTTDQMFFSATNTYIRFGNGTEDTLWLNFRGTGGTNYFFQTTQVFRDPAAWYHIVLAVDTTQATDTNRVKLYVNGSRITAFTTYADYPPQNTDTAVNATSAQALGSYTTGALYFDGYMAEIRMIDGQQLTPSSFAKTEVSTGQWIPIKYSGTYGTNGYYLPFTNTASTSTLGNDFSGNGNTWTVNNVSLTAGITYDSMTDVPTLTNATTANYAVLNPVDKGSSINLSNGNLQYDASGSIVQFSRSTLGVTTGKWYFEINAATLGNGNVEWGIANQSASVTNYIGSDTNGWGFAPQTSGSSYKYNNGNAITYGTATGTGTYACAFDADAGKVWFSDKTGAWIDSGNPAVGTNESFSGLTGTLFASLGQYSGSSQTTQAQINFGQRSFAYTPPSGFKALNTYNLP